MRENRHHPGRLAAKGRTSLRRDPTCASLLDPVLRHIPAFTSAVALGGGEDGRTRVGRFRIEGEGCGGMDYVGYNGTISVQGEDLVIARHGVAARLGGLGAGGPRRIPLQAVSGVFIKPATRLTNGWLTLGLGGEPATDIDSKTAASHPDTILFRHKDDQMFTALHQWLLKVVAYNQSVGVDFTSVPFDHAEPGRLDRLRERADRPQASAEQRKNPNAGTDPGLPTVNVVPTPDTAALADDWQRNPPREAASARATRRAGLGAPVQPWARANVWQNVVGENNYGPALKRLLKANNVRPRPDEYGTELEGLPAAVVAEPGNPYDPNAVKVLVQNELVGYLPRDDAAAYSAPLQDLAQRGEYLAVSARVWVAPREDERAGSVTVMLPPPDGVQSFNEPPDVPHRVLPPGGAIQVTGEENHMDVLTRYLSDRERHLAVTLHIVQEQKTERSQPYQAIEVRLDGQRVGVLTKAMSEKVADLVAYIAERNLLPVCRAVLKGSPLRAELVLFVAKSHEVTSKWLESVGTAG